MERFQPSSCPTRRGQSEWRRKGSDFRPIETSRRLSQGLENQEQAQDLGAPHHDRLRNVEGRRRQAQACVVCSGIEGGGDSVHGAGLLSARQCSPGESAIQYPFSLCQKRRKPERCRD